nr:beta-hexosaminidase [Oscillospiraceae bacterium]
MKLFILLLCLLLTGCASTEPIPTVPAQTTLPPAAETTSPLSTEPTAPTQASVQEEKIRRILSQLTIEERVGQLFLARCDETVAIDHASAYHLGGYVLFDRDFEQETPQSMADKLAGYQAAATLPLLIAVDEEGGTVTRVSSHRAFRDTAFPSPRKAYERGGWENLRAVEEEKCALLQSLGINVNLGPVCDIATDKSAFLYPRSFGQDPVRTSQFVSQTVELMRQYGIGSVLKHFPGYGNNADTHTGIVSDSRSLESLEGYDLVPFQAGIDAGCGAIMVSHTIVEALDDTLPASLSPAVHRYLREEMGFTGVILTDDLVMQAITEQYGAGEAAVLAILAGNDLLCSTEYMQQYEAVLEAVTLGRIDFDTLNNAVRNVLEWKLELGLL